MAETKTLARVIPIQKTLPGPKFLDDLNACEHVIGGMCSKCIANIRAEAFQRGYASGYKDGQDHAGGDAQ